MLTRVAAIALNTYREAVRARVLYGLLAAALATSAYSLVVATLSLRQETRVVSDVGAASTSLYAVLVAIVLGASSLHRELELKTIFPILTRRLRRHEYLLGKYLGTLATLSAFVALDGALVLGILAFESGQDPKKLAMAALGAAALLAIGLWRMKQTRVYVMFPWAFAVFAMMAILASTSPDERRLVIASAILTVCEVGIVSAVAVFFSSFSSPFLTAIFTLGVFLIGRSADTLANLPPRVFGQGIHDGGATIARIFPNLHVYVPPRPLLLGQAPDAPVWSFVGAASMHAVFYAMGVLVIAAAIFRKRDFQ